MLSDSALPEDLGEWRELLIAVDNFSLSDVSERPQQRFPAFLPGQVSVEESRVSQEAERAFLGDAADALVELLLQDWHAINEVVSRVASELRLAAAPLPRPVFLQHLRQGEQLAGTEVDDAFHAVFQVVQRLPGWCEGLEVELRAVQAVLAEQQPHPRVHNAGLASGVVTEDRGVSTAWFKREVADALEALENQSLKSHQCTLLVCCRPGSTRRPASSRCFCRPSFVNHSFPAARPRPSIARRRGSSRCADASGLQAGQFSTAWLSGFQIQPSPSVQHSHLSRGLMLGPR